MNKPKNEAKAKGVFGSQREPALFPHFDILDIHTSAIKVIKAKGNMHVTELAHARSIKSCQEEPK
jgi:hypothetical protein